MHNDKQENRPMRRYYCDFGIVHELREPCGCKDRYGVYPGTFKAELQRTFGGEGRYVYSGCISEKMRQTVIASLKGRDHMEARKLA